MKLKLGDILVSNGFLAVNKQEFWCIYLCQKRIDSYCTIYMRDENPNRYYFSNWGSLIEVII